MHRLVEEQHGGRKAEDKGKTKTCPIRGVSDFIHGGKGGGGKQMFLLLGAASNATRVRT